MEHDAIVKIKYQMKRFANKMRRRRMEAEYKQANKKKGPKTNKFGNPVRRNTTVTKQTSSVAK